MKNSPHISITSRGNGLGKAFSELLQSGTLLRVLIFRDLKIRYAQTYLGFLWSVLQPLTGLAIIFVLFFKLANLQPQGTPYLPFALSGLILWNYFSYLTSQSAAVLINMQSMIKKIYFPKLSLPLSKALVGLVDFTVGLGLLIGLLLYYQIPLPGIVGLLVALVFALLAASGIGMLLSAFSIRYRDLQQLIPFVTQMLFFVTPVAYSSEVALRFLGDYGWLYFINPMSGALSLVHHSLFNLPLPPFYWLSFVVSIALFLTGIMVFNRAEKKMADLL